MWPRAPRGWVACASPARHSSPGRSRRASRASGVTLRRPSLVVGASNQPSCSQVQPHVGWRGVLAHHRHRPRCHWGYEDDQPSPMSPWMAPCPTPGTEQRYVFSLYAPGSRSIRPHPGSDEGGRPGRGCGTCTCDADRHLHAVICVSLVLATQAAGRRSDPLTQPSPGCSRPRRPPRRRSTNSNSRPWVLGHTGQQVPRRSGNSQT